MSVAIKEATLEVSGLVLTPTRLKGREAVSEPFRYELLFSLPVWSHAADVTAGSSATLTLRDALGGARTVVGIVGEAKSSAFDNGRAALELTLVPASAALAVGQRSRAWVEASVVDVATAVLAAYAGSWRLALAETYSKEPYRVELGEDDWSFLSRSLEAEGIYYYFDQDGASTLVLSDHSTSSVGSATRLSVLLGSALSEQSDAILELGSVVTVASGSVASRSFSWKNPALSLSASTGGGRYEAYDSHGAGPATQESQSRKLNLAAGAISARAASVGGRSNSLSIVPGRAIDITGSSGADLDGPHFVTAVTIEDTGSDRAFDVQFEAIAAVTPFRPAATTRVPAQGGLAWGFVVAAPGDEVYPDTHGRVRVQMQWDTEGGRDASAGTWMRVAQRGAPGSMMFPRTGWVVATWNEEGHPDAPMVLARIHDGEHTPSYALPENKTRVVYKTATVPGGGTFNELHFEDAAGRQDVFWNASRDLHIKTKHDKSETVKQDATHFVGRDQSIHVTDTWTESIVGSQTIAIDDDTHHEVKKQRGKTVAGDDAIQIGGNRKLHVGASHTLSAKENRTMTVGSTEIDVSLGQIAWNAKAALTLIGAAGINLAAQTRTDGSGGDSFEVVGAIKIDNATKHRNCNVQGEFSETIGMNLLIDAGARFSDTTDGESSWDIGGLLDVSSVEVLIEAKKQLELRVGASSVVLTPEGITIQTVTLLLEGGELEATTNTIKHNG